VKSFFFGLRWAQSHRISFLLNDGGNGRLVEGIHRLIEGADDEFGRERRW